MPETYAVDVGRLMTASSLAALVDARARLAETELATLEDRRAALEADRANASADVAAYAALLDHRPQVRDRLRREALRVVGDGGVVPARLSSVERDAVADELVLASALAERERRLLEDGDAQDALTESVAAKHAELARLAARASALTRASDVSAGQIELLRALADDATAAANAIAELMRGASAQETATAWTWPVTGPVTQPFGPSLLALEPTIVYRGIAIAHFHDAVDIAAPLGSAVVAAAPGRVTFVGHLPDGAMVVVIAHDDGLVSLSAHLDDAFAPPAVKQGDRVVRGQVIGYVGVTGITTGPHLHFSVHEANGPVDPLVLLLAR